ncbi:sorbosone dehydrogenase family protein [bacterium]|nr:sorbosone dehydrogenase family protein [bacterium]
MLLVAAGCTGFSRSGVERQETSPLALLPPPPASLARGAAFDPADLSKDGAEYEEALGSQRVTAEDREALFDPDYDLTSPQAGFAGVAYGIYRFLIDDYDGPATIDLIWKPSAPPGQQYWLGLANVAEQRWEWYEGQPTLEFAGFAPYLYGSGEILLAIIVLGTEQQNLFSLQIGPYPPLGELQLEEITLPPGFSISRCAYPVGNARALALGEGGTLFVGSRTAGNVYAITDYNGDYRADEVRTIAQGYTQPVGVDFRDGSLYFSAIDEIWRLDAIEDNLDNPPSPVLVADFYPTDVAHGWRFIKFGPDGNLYVPIGAPCNICDEGDPYASITRIDPFTGFPEIFARGVRNTVGFDWHPVTGEMWFTDNGRDRMGDDVPPDELNLAPVPGMHFGYPYWHGIDIPDPVYGDGHTADEFDLPAWELEPHVAALGMRFYTGQMFPEEYRNQIFIAEHGSWDRSVPIGARVMLVRLAEDNRTALSYEVFAEGWQWPDGSRWGRPVDVLVMPDGSLLVSDDHAGAIYRISYAGEA